jgi:hypothetical protein
MTGTRAVSPPLLLFLALSAACASAASLQRLTGRLEPDFVEPGWRLVLPAREAEAGGGPLACEKTAPCFGGTLRVGPRTYLRTGAEISILLSERTAQTPLLFADLNLDGRLDAGESAPMHPTSDARGSWEVVLHFRTGQAHAAPFAYLFRLMPPEAGAHERVLRVASDVAAIQGRVDIDGRSVLVVLPYDLADDRAELRTGYFGMDGNGDGVIDKSPVSPEYAYARDEEVVFRVGTRYFSVAKADRRHRRLVLQEHPPEDYQRIELQRGATIPPLDFRPLDSSERSPLIPGPSYTLLFFWGLGCGAWDSDVPTANEALQRFGRAGLSVVAISDAPDDDSIRKTVKDREALWTQAAAADGRALYVKRFRISATPTLILVDGHGRIISRNQPGEPPLRGPGLLRTLEQLFPPGSRSHEPAS